MFAVVKHPEYGSKGVFSLNIQKDVDIALLDISTRHIRLMLEKERVNNTTLKDTTLFKLWESKKDKIVEIRLNRDDYEDVIIRRLSNAFEKLSTSKIFPRPFGNNGRKTFKLLLFLGDEIISEIDEALETAFKPGSIADRVGIGMAKTAMKFFTESRYDKD